jgi:DNA-binding beta-propeller fold protein YncE
MLATSLSASAMPVVRRARHMHSPLRQTKPASRTIAAHVALAALALPATAFGAKAPQPAHKQASSRGALVQLSGAGGCLVDRSTKPPGKCGSARALKGPGPFMGSRAIALSPDGKNAYVASSASDAIAIFNRGARSGKLTQAKGSAGCIAAAGAAGCAPAIGLDGPNSVAVSADGRNVYATARDSSSVVTFLRNPKTGALAQAPGGCVSALPLPGCGAGRALGGPDVVVASPDGKNVYVGAFFGNAVVVFNRDPATGVLTQPADASGCIVETATSGCTTGLALSSVEGMAISEDGKNVYAAAAVSNALLNFSRDTSTGALIQATDGSGCIVDAPLAGCTTGTELSGANAVAISPDDGDVYVTSLLSNSVTSFTRSASTGALAQKAGSAGCVVFLRAAGCSLGHALAAPEGLAVAPDGANVYAAAFASSAVDVLDRNRKSGGLIQKPLRAGCLSPHPGPDCSSARSLTNVSSIALSPDGRFAYATAFGANAVAVFRRTTSQHPHR